MQHRTDVEKRGDYRTPEGTRWVVSCTCGYQSREYERRKDALNDEGEHVRLMSGER